MGAVTCDARFFCSSQTNDRAEQRHPLFGRSRRPCDGQQEPGVLEQRSHGRSTRAAPKVENAPK